MMSLFPVPQRMLAAVARLAGRQLSRVLRRSAPLIASAWCAWVSRTLWHQEILLSGIAQQLKLGGTSAVVQPKERKAMYQSAHVHYLNKYPGGKVVSTDLSLDAYDKYGAHRVALRKTGAGSWEDRSAAHGAADRHDLAPIPKDARAFKLFENGEIGKAEEHASRAPKGHDYAGKFGGKVPSEKELAEHAKAEAAKPAPAPAAPPSA